MTLIIANWKMHPKTLADAKKLLKATQKAATGLRGVQTIIAPPAVFLRDLKSAYRGKSIAFASQDVHFEMEGAFTGLLSPLQVRDAGALYTLIGHSERRERGETDEDVRRKVTAAMHAGLTPIVCVGEKERDHHGGKYLSVIATQVQTAISGIPQNAKKSVIIAYEPVWAIGKKEAMRPDDMHQTVLYIRKILVGLLGQKGHKMKILYGGSVDPGNAPAMVTQGAVDGLLVGRVSIDVKQFPELLRALSSKKK